MYRFFVVFILFFSFSVVSAQVEITEIMYDLEGSDTSREWIEIYNNGTEDVDLHDWWFVDIYSGNEKRHKFLSYPKEGGDVVVKSNSYAVIVIKPDIFLSDWSGFSGKILDSSFSLLNTGELLIIRDSELNEVDSVVYSSEWGASGDGNSLQKVDDVWGVGSPTPGDLNNLTQQEIPPKYDDTPLPEQDENVSAPKYEKPEPYVTADAGEKERVVVAGVGTEFKGVAITKAGGELSNSRYVWSFGDGARVEGKVVEHVYEYPGEYSVLLSVSSGFYGAMDKVKIIVIPVDIIISNAGGEDDFFVEVKNNANYELNVSGWKIKAGSKTFIFPEDTYIFAKNSVRLSPKITRLVFNKKVSLLYPNDTFVDVYGVENSVDEIVHYNEPVTNKIGNFSGGTDVIKDEAGDMISSASLIKGDTQLMEEVATHGGDENAEFAQIASVYETKKSTLNKDIDGLFWGLLGVSFIVLVAIYALLDSKNRPVTSSVKSEADLYKIIEIDTD